LRTVPDFANPRSGLDVERVVPIVDMVKQAAAHRGRPQLVRVTAWRDDHKLGMTLCTNESVQYAVTGYPEATRLTVEVLGNA
jgi:hypothetical protein